AQRRSGRSHNLLTTLDLRVYNSGEAVYPKRDPPHCFGGAARASVRCPALSSRPAGVRGAGPLRRPLKIRCAEPTSMWVSAPRVYPLLLAAGIGFGVSRTAGRNPPC